MRLLAERHRKVVASTSWKTFAPGTRELVLRLDRKQWPTKLNLKTKLLGKLPTSSLRGPGNNTVTTGLVKLPEVPPFGQFGGL